MSTTKAASSAPLPIVRLALLGSGFLSGVAGWGVAHLVQARPLQSVTIDGLPFPITEAVVMGGLLFVIGLLFAGILWMKRRRAEQAPSTDSHSNLIAGWALAEAGSFLGAGFLLLTGDPTVFAAGFALQVLTSFKLLPVPPSHD